MEEATSSLLSILQDILAGSTVGASTGVTGISSNVRNETDLGVKDANVEAETSPQGELQADMTDMTPKRPSESAEVEVKRPRMADECLGDEKSTVFWLRTMAFYQSTMRHQQTPLYSTIHHIDVG